MRNQKWNNLRLFAAVVRSPAPVRNSFKGHLILDCWWKMVLALHGKPKPVDLSAKERNGCIAGGFRFYGWLYRVLSLILGMAAVLYWAENTVSSFCIAWLLVSALFLWIAAGLAFTGSAEFVSSSGERIWHLVAFLVFIALFLTSSLAVICFQTWHAGWLPDSLNILLSVGIIAFGVGSYFIELAALVTNLSAKKARLE